MTTTQTPTQTKQDREYVRYCLRYAVLVLGKRRCVEYINSLTPTGDER